MSVSLFWELYLIIGIIYTIINGLYRELATEDDWMLVFVWTFLWWICFAALFVQYISKRINKL